jgi:hypothetical protein
MYWPVVRLFGIPVHQQTDTIQFQFRFPAISRANTSPNASSSITLIPKGPLCSQAAVSLVPSGP